MRPLFVLALSLILFVPAAPAAEQCLDIFTDQRYDMGNLEIMLPEMMAYEKNSRRREEFLASPEAAIAKRFRVVTWNLNLLSFSWNVRGKDWLSLKTADYAQRSELMRGWIEQYLRSEESPDVLMLQEIWTAADDAMIAQVARDAGYVPLLRDPELVTSSGMQILVRESAVAQSIAARVEKFDIKKAMFFEKLGHVERGLLYSKVVLPNGGKLLVGNVHLTPFPKNRSARKEQLKSLVEILNRVGADVDFIVLGGDFNVASDFSNTSFSSLPHYLSGRGLYDDFAWQSGALDVFRALNPMGVNGYTYNPDFKSIFPFAFDRPRQRIDYIWVRENSPDGRVYVDDVQILFRDKINEAGEPDENGFYPSDHYALGTDLFFF